MKTRLFKTDVSVSHSKIIEMRGNSPPSTKEIMRLGVLLSKQEYLDLCDVDAIFWYLLHCEDAREPTYVQGLVGREPEFIYSNPRRGSASGGIEHHHSADIAKSFVLLEGMGVNCNSREFIEPLRQVIKQKDKITLNELRVLWADTEPLNCSYAFIWRDNQGHSKGLETEITPNGRLLFRFIDQDNRLVEMVAPAKQAKKHIKDDLASLGLMEEVNRARMLGLTNKADIVNYESLGSSK